MTAEERAFYDEMRRFDGGDGLCDSCGLPTHSDFLPVSAICGCEEDELAMGRPQCTGGHRVASHIPFAVTVACPDCDWTRPAISVCPTCGTQLNAPPKRSTSEVIEWVRKQVESLRAFGNNPRTRQ